MINRDCKVAPIKRYLAEMAGSCRKVRKNIVQHIGIALDEPKRLQRLGGNKISLLAKYGYTEEAITSMRDHIAQEITNVEAVLVGRSKAMKAGYGSAVGLPLKRKQLKELNFILNDK